MNEHVYALSIDYDGCGQSPLVRGSIYSAMLGILTSDPSAVIVILVGSARQSNFRNLWNMNLNKNGNCFRVLNKFATLQRVDDDEDLDYEVLREKLQPHQSRIIMDKFLLEDIEEGTPAGTHFTMGLALPENEDASQGVYNTTTFPTANIPWFDEGKVGLAAAQIRHVLFTYAEAKSVNYWFFDDTFRVLEKVYAAGVRNRPVLPSKLTVQIINASDRRLGVFGDALHGERMNNTPAPYTRTECYELFFEVLTGESEQSKIIRRLIENERMPGSQPPSSSLFVYLSLFVNNPIKWNKLCLLLKDEWPRMFPDLLWGIAKQKNNVEALTTLLKHYESMSIELKTEKQETSILRTMRLEERINLFASTFVDLLLTGKQDAFHDLANAYFSISPHMKRNINTLSEWTLNVRTTDLVLSKLTEMVCHLSQCQTNTMSYFSLFLKTISQAPKSFNTLDGKIAWAVLLNMNPFCVEDDHHGLETDEGVGLYLSLALKLFSSVIAPIQLQNTIAEHSKCYLSFRLFTTNQLKTDPVDMKDYLSFVKKIRGATLEQELIELSVNPRTPFELQIHTVLTEKLKGRMLDPNLKASIHELELMLARERPSTQMAADDLIQRWSLKQVQTSMKTHNDIWDESITKQPCNAKFFKEQDTVDIVTALKRCWGLNLQVKERSDSAIATTEPSGRPGSM